MVTRLVSTRSTSAPSVSVATFSGTTDVGEAAGVGRFGLMPIPGNLSLTFTERVVRGLDSEYCPGSAEVEVGLGVGFGAVRLPDCADVFSVPIDKITTKVQNPAILKFPLAV